MLERHYAPQARLILFDAVEDALVRKTLETYPAGMVGAVVLASAARPPGARTLRLPNQAAGYGRALYQALHQLDDAGVAVILVQRPPAAPEWAAVHDRLQRAAGSPA